MTIVRWWYVCGKDSEPILKSFTQFLENISKDWGKGSLDSDFKCNTRVPVVGTDSRIKHLAFRSQVFFLAGGSTHLEPCVSPDC